MVHWGWELRFRKASFRSLGSSELPVTRGEFPVGPQRQRMGSPKCRLREWVGQVVREDTNRLQDQPITSASHNNLRGRALNPDQCDLDPPKSDPPPLTNFLISLTNPSLSLRIRLTIAFCARASDCGSYFSLHEIISSSRGIRSKPFSVRV